MGEHDFEVTVDDGAETMDETWGTEGSGSLSARQLRAHTRHAEQIAMSPRWVAEKRSNGSPPSLKCGMAFPGENSSSFFDVVGEPLTMHRHLTNSRRRSRWTPTFMWPVGSEDSIDTLPAQNRTFPSVSSTIASHQGLGPHVGSASESITTSAPRFCPTLEQAMRGEFGFRTAGTSLASTADVVEASPRRAYHGVHQFLPSYMACRSKNAPSPPRPAHPPQAPTLPAAQLSSRGSQPLSPPRLAHPRPAEGSVTSRFGTCGIWPAPCPPPSLAPPRSKKPTPGEIALRESQKARKHDGLTQYLLPPGRHVVWHPQTQPSKHHPRPEPVSPGRAEPQGRTLKTAYGTLRIASPQRQASPRVQLEAGGYSSEAFQEARRRSANAFASLVGEIGAEATRRRQ